MRKLIAVFILILSVVSVSCGGGTSSGNDNAAAGDNDIIIADNIAVNDDAVQTEGDGAAQDDADVVSSVCIGISLGELTVATAGYNGVLSENIGSADLEDIISFQFYIPGKNTPPAELTVGSYDLGAGKNKNYATCSECVLGYLDYDPSTGTAAKRFFQESGTLEITEIKAGTLESKGIVSAKLVEVTVDTSTFESTAVEGGACLEFEAAAWNTICVPDCEGKVCGMDGCGGVCGAGCEDGKQCNDAQTECIGCTVISIDTITGSADYPGLYEAMLKEDIGEQGSGDTFRIEFLGAQTAGEFKLGEGDNANYMTCGQCVVVAEDADAVARNYFQQSGTMTITDLKTDAEGGITEQSAGSIVNVRLVEVAIDGNTYESTPIKGGGCLEIKTASWDTMTATQGDADTETTDL